jgi:signal transduction histidine kinase
VGEAAASQSAGAGEGRPWGRGPWGRGPWGAPEGEWAGPGPYRPRRPPGVRLAIFLALVQLGGTYLAARHAGAGVRPLGDGGYPLLAGSALVLAVRRPHRMGALVLAVGATLAYYALHFPDGPYFLAAFAALAGAIIAGYRTTTWIVAGLGYAFVVGFGRFVPTLGDYSVPAPGIGPSVAVGAWILVTLAVAEAIRNRANAMREIGRTRAEQARTRAEQQRRQTSEERLRIAQELHDVVGHHLSLINVQAGVGLHLMDERPEQARVALQAIKAASSEALAEVRAVLGLLREQDGAAPRAPVPSLANLDTLLDTARLVTTGDPVPLPPEVDRAAYRIVREALTNVRRHAGEGASATVTIGYRPDALTVQVSDDGAGVRAGAPIAEGNGLAGMRARAEALGGVLTAGGRAGGGFEVSSTLPLPAARTEPPAPGGVGCEGGDE